MSASYLCGRYLSEHRYQCGALLADDAIDVNKVRGHGGEDRALPYPPALAASRCKGDG